MSYQHQTVGVYRESKADGVEEGAIIYIDYVDMHGARVHIHKCPQCSVLTESEWQDVPENHFLGWACAVCDAIVDNQYDPTPMEQWEVTEGSGEKERFETMLRQLP